MASVIPVIIPVSNNQPDFSNPIVTICYTILIIMLICIIVYMIYTTIKEYIQEHKTEKFDIPESHVKMIHYIDDNNIFRSKIVEI